MRNLLLLSALLCFQIASAYRVVGYLPSYRLSMGMTSIDYSKYTHMCLSFANPNTSGVFSYPSSLTSIVDKIHQTSCKAMISIGGGGVSNTVVNTYETYTEAPNRSAFIHNLIEFTVDNNLDGIDVDLEGSLVQMSTYDDFVIELSDSCASRGLITSAALAQWTGTYVSTNTIKALDFINIMAYDATGPWNINNAGQHSSMSFAQSNFTYWKGKGAKLDQLVLGLPFYGYEFQSTKADAWTWCQIANAFPNNINDDQVTTNNGTLYYNGVKTIEDKVQYTVDQNGGGVMIWESGQDCFNANSMLDVIIQKMQSLSVSTQDVLTHHEWKVYPNPSNGVFQIDTHEKVKIEVYSSIGELILTTQEKRFDLSSFSSGVYFLNVELGNSTFVERIVLR